MSIIMDGNGRWAVERGRERVYGHLHGVESVRMVTECCVEEGVRYLSLYAFSEENWGRPQSEVSYLMSLMQKEISDVCEDFMKNGVKFIVLGDMERLNPALREAISGLENLTAGNTALIFIVFLSYSGRWDILQAVNGILKDRDRAAGPVTAEEFSSRLVTAGIPDPDLIIRTSGEERISNYLLWQGAYSELYFTDVLWPDFGKEEFRKALEAYASRDRRFGKVK